MFLLSIRISVDFLPCFCSHFIIAYRFLFFNYFFTVFLLSFCSEKHFCPCLYSQFVVFLLFLSVILLSFCIFEVIYPCFYSQFIFGIFTVIILSFSVKSLLISVNPLLFSVFLLSIHNICSFYPCFYSQFVSRER